MASTFAPPPPPPTELGYVRRLSKSAGIRCSPLALGCMSIGDAWKDMMGSMDKEQSFKLMDAYFEAGGNFLDTANGYQDEQSEQWIGEWMHERKNRHLMVLATKYSIQYNTYRLGKEKTTNFAGNHRRSMVQSLEDSLEKLQTKYIDIFYVHYWDWTTSIEELMNSLQILVEQGKVLYLGISDTPAWIVAACNDYARFHGKTQFSVYQGRWNIMMRDFERDIIPMARHYGMALAPWDVLGGGRLKTKEAIEEQKKAGEKLRAMHAPPEQTEKEIRTSEALCKVGAEHGVESPTAVALAYVMSKAVDVFPIIGGRKVEHLHDNIKALSMRLSEKQVEYLESVSDFDIGFPMNMTAEDPHVTGKAGMFLAGSGPMKFNRLMKPMCLE